MAKIYLRSRGAEAWKPYLAQPDRQWKTGYSAKTLAYAWEEADRLPAEVAAILSPLGAQELLLAIPEYKVSLPGGTTESQSDVFALVKIDGGLVACMVEGKVDEPFGPTLAEWLVGASPGKQVRLAYLKSKLGLDEALAQTVRYQLLHRTAAAIIEAERFGASDAAMIVQSFSPTRMWLTDFQAFCHAIGAGSPSPDQLATVPLASGVRLHLGWASGDQRFLSSCAVPSAPG